MNVLAITSRQLAPQEEWIFRGVKHLMEVSFQNHMNWVIYDSNPDLLEFDGTLYSHKRQMVSNSFHHQTLQPFSAVVFAGGNRWLGPSLQGLYSLIAQHELPVFALGLRQPENPQGLDGNELTCLQKHTTILTVADPTTKFFLSRYDIDPTVLPCPSLFCTSRTVGETAKGIGFFLQAEGSATSKNTEPTVRQLITLANFLDAEARLFCPTLDDFMRFSPVLEKAEYYYDSALLLDKIRHLKTVVTTDITIATVANAFLTPAVLICDKTPNSIKGLPFVFPSKLENAKEKIQSIHGKNLSQDIQNWKEDSRQKWIKILQGEVSLSPEKAA